MNEYERRAYGERVRIALSRRRLLGGAAGAAAAVALTRAGAAAQATPAGSLEASPVATPAGSPIAQATGEQIFYHYGVFEDPTSFDWNLDLYCNAEETTFAGLVTFDENLAVVADWAERFEANADGSVYTFSLRRDNTGWSNGDSVTAHDFIWSWTRLLDPANATAYPFIVFDIKNAESFNTGTPVAREGDPLNGRVATAADLGMRAIDDYTLEVTLEGPRGNFLQKVAYTACYPSHRPSVEQHGEQWALGDVPLVSNGPFKLDRWEHDVAIYTSKNPGYWNAEAIRLEQVITPIVPAANSVLNYESGSGDQKLDWTNISVSDIDRYTGDPALAATLTPYPYPGIWFMIPSNGVPPFDRVEVRRALSHAIDRTRLVQVTKGLALEAYCMVSPGVFGYFDDQAIADIQRFDPQLAMDALRGTEFEGGQNWPPITMYMRASEENYNADVMANDIVAQLQQNLGMQIAIEAIPQANFSPQLFENRWQLVFIRWWYDYPDADNGYGDMFYSRKSSGKRQAWSNAEFDDLVIAGRTEPNPDARLEIYKQLERIIQEDAGYVPLVYRLDQYAIKPFVKGVPVNRLGNPVPDGNIYVRMLASTFVTERP